MPEQTFKSAGVSAREIDLSGPSRTGPQGTPAGIIGTAVKGPAFVPITIASFKDFTKIFGGTLSADKTDDLFGPIAMYEWMRFAKAGTYIRTLGIGSGKTRESDGSVENAGFTVGEKIPQANGILGSNAMASGGNVLGRTYFLGALHFQPSDSKSLADAGILAQQYSTLASSASAPLIRGVLFAPHNVAISLSGSVNTNNIPATALTGGFATKLPKANHDGGSSWGMLDYANDDTFVVLLNGHKASSQYPNIITASMDVRKKNYFAKVLNTDPANTEKAGHCLYSHYDVHPRMLSLSSSVIPAMFGSTAAFHSNKDPVNKDRHHTVFVLSGAAGRNTSSAAKPNYEGFKDRFQTAKTPWIVSQQLGGQYKNLFRFHHLSDGEAPTSQVKISIESIAKSTDTRSDYGSFVVRVRRFSDSDVEMKVLETFRCNLDPNSERYIGRVIGDQNTYFDFDKPTRSQKLVTAGLYPNRSNFIRVEVHPDVADAAVSAKALPCGHRGYYHLSTDGNMLAGDTFHTGHVDGSAAGLRLQGFLTGAVRTPPLPYRMTVHKGNSANNIRKDSRLYWGAQFKMQADPTRPNRSSRDAQVVHAQNGRYFGSYDLNGAQAWLGGNEGAAKVGGAVVDADKFNNHFFHLERIYVHTKSAEDIVDNTKWQFAQYSRDGDTPSAAYATGGSLGNRFINVEKDFGQLASRKYLKFTVYMQGGFDGLNIAHEDKHKMNNNAAVREMSDSENQGGVTGPTVAAYRKALDIMAEKSDVDIQILAIPGIREPGVTTYAIDQTEARFDAIYIMDLPEYDAVNSAIVTGSDAKISVTTTVNQHQSRALDTSFAATYFPDVVMPNPAMPHKNVRVPPSVGVLGALSYNDQVAHPWFAPAGFSRGALSRVSETQVKLSKANMDALYEGDINPITAFPASGGPVIYGQKTMLQAQSALDRVNVRRLLIDIRRKVKAVGNLILFEPNRADTLAKFSAAVTPILTRIQAQQGLDRFKVVIDTTTTTQEDVENNTVRGKIFLQPTRSVEFISLDFVVTNAGTEV